MQQESTSQLNDYYKSLEAGKIKPKESLPTTIAATTTEIQNSSWPGGGQNSDLATFIQFEICKKLCEHYEKLDDNYMKFTRILNAESKFAQLASKFVAAAAGSGASGIDPISVGGNTIISGNGDTLVSSIETMAAAAASVASSRPPAHHYMPTHSNHHHQQHHGHLYFRIGLFGRSLKFECIQNQYFLYRHKSYEMLSNIQSLIINKIAHGGPAGSNEASSLGQKVKNRLLISLK